HLQRGDGNVGQNHRALVGELADLGRDLEADAALRHDDRRKGKTDPEFLEFDGYGAELLGDRNGELAAGEEIRRLARNGGQVRLSQGMQQPVLFQHAKHALNAASAALPLRAEARGVGHRRVGRQGGRKGGVVAADVRFRAGEERGEDALARHVDGEGKIAQRSEGEIARIDERVQIDAELLDDVALHLDHRDLEQHLLAPLDSQHVDDVGRLAGVPESAAAVSGTAVAPAVAVHGNRRPAPARAAASLLIESAQEAGDDLASASRVDGRRDRAGQYDAFADALDLDMRIRKEAIEELFKA